MRIKLLHDFTLQGILWSFSRFNLSARKLPAILQWSITTLRGKHTPFAILYYGCHHFNPFHNTKSI